VAFFAWSPEDGTAALSLDRRVPAATARDRVERLQELQDRILGEVQAGWVGRELELLVERTEAPRAAAAGAPPAGVTAEGRSFREGVDADGVVRVEDCQAQVGDYLPVVVTAAEGPELVARPVRAAPVP